MDNWVTVHVANDGVADGPVIMGYYERADIPAHYALADAFTICDHYHCSVLGPTPAVRRSGRHGWWRGFAAGPTLIGATALLGAGAVLVAATAPVPADEEPDDEG